MVLLRQLLGDVLRRLRLRQVWIALRANERAVLEQVTLADIVAGNLPDMVRHLTENPRAWV